MLGRVTWLVELGSAGHIVLYWHFREVGLGLDLPCGYEVPLLGTCAGVGVDFSFLWGIV